MLANLLAGHRTGPLFRALSRQGALSSTCMLLSTRAHPSPPSVVTTNEPLKNERLCHQLPVVRQIGADGKLQTAVASVELLAALPPHHDLVLVDIRQSPPVVRFQERTVAIRQAQNKAEAETRARLANKLKEMHVSTVAQEHDLTVKLDRINEWICKGWRVHVVIEEKRRRTSSLGPVVDAKRDLMQRIVSKLSAVAEIAGNPETERGKLLFTLHGNAKTLNALKRERSQQPPSPSPSPSPSTDNKQN